MPLDTTNALIVINVLLICTNMYVLFRQTRPPSPTVNIFKPTTIHQHNDDFGDDDDWADDWAPDPDEEYPDTDDEDTDEYTPPPSPLNRITQYDRPPFFPSGN